MMLAVLALTTCGVSPHWRTVFDKSDNEERGGFSPYRDDPSRPDMRISIDELIAIQDIEDAEACIYDRSTPVQENCIPLTNADWNSRTVGDLTRIESAGGPYTRVKKLIGLLMGYGWAGRTPAQMPNPSPVATRELRGPRTRSVRGRNDAGVRQQRLLAKP